MHPASTSIKAFGLYVIVIDLAGAAWTAQGRQRPNTPARTLNSRISSTPTSP